MNQEWKDRPWFYDESKRTGVDHSDNDYPAHYEKKMRLFRNFEDEARHYVELLGIKKAIVSSIWERERGPLRSRPRE
jgi:hypothetical protein